MFYLITLRHFGIIPRLMLFCHIYSLVLFYYDVVTVQGYTMHTESKTRVVSSGRISCFKKRLIIEAFDFTWSQGFF